MERMQSNHQQSKKRKNSEDPECRCSKHSLSNKDADEESPMYTEESLLLDLPTEILLRILNFLSLPKDLVSITSTCKFCCNLVHDEEEEGNYLDIWWKQEYISRWGHLPIGFNRNDGMPNWKERYKARIIGTTNLDLFQVEEPTWRSIAPIKDFSLQQKVNSIVKWACGSTSSHSTLLALDFRGKAYYYFTKGNNFKRIILEHRDDTFVDIYAASGRVYILKNTLGNIAQNTVREIYTQPRELGSSFAYYCSYQSTPVCKAVMSNTRVIAISDDHQALCCDISARSYATRKVLRSIPQLTGKCIVDVVYGSHFMFLTDQGQVYQMPETGREEDIPELMDIPARIVAMANGAHISIALDDKDRLWMWKLLPDFDIKYSNPVPLPQFANAKIAQLHSSLHRVFVILESGQVCVLDDVEEDKEFEYFWTGTIYNFCPTLLGAFVVAS